MIGVGLLDEAAGILELITQIAQLPLVERALGAVERRGVLAGDQIGDDGFQVHAFIYPTPFGVAQ